MPYARVQDKHYEMTGWFIDREKIKICAIFICIFPINNCSPYMEWKQAAESDFLIMNNTTLQQLVNQCRALACI